MLWLKRTFTLMDESLCTSFLLHLDREGVLDCGEASPEIREWLKTLGLPNCLRFLLEDTWPRENFSLAGLNLFSLTKIRASSFTAPVLERGFLAIGTAANGDFLVIDVSSPDCTSGFIDHSSWSPWVDEPGNPRDFFEPIAPTFERFLSLVVEHRFIPRDYYDARGFNRLKSDPDQAATDFP